MTINSIFKIEKSLKIVILKIKLDLIIVIKTFFKS